MGKKPTAEKSEPLGERMGRQHFTEILAAMIVDARHKASLAAEDLANEIGVSRGTLSIWENGRGLPDLFSFTRLAQRLHLSVDEIVLGEDVAGQIWYEKFAEESAGKSDTAIPSYIGHGNTVGHPNRTTAVGTVSQPNEIAELKRRIAALERKGKRTRRKP